MWVNGRTSRGFADLKLGDGQRIVISYGTGEHQPTGRPAASRSQRSAASTADRNALMPNAPSRRAATRPLRLKAKTQGSVSR